MIAVWEDLEDAIDKALAEEQRWKPLAYIRLYDSKAAGALMPSQPADFLVTAEGETTLIEAKFSEVHESLKSCFSGHVRGHQLASARIWDRANARYIFLFYSSVTEKFEAWHGVYCAECRAQSKRLSLGRRRQYNDLFTALRKELHYA